jgi:hypothetical protein
LHLRNLHSEFRVDGIMRFARFLTFCQRQASSLLTVAGKLGIRSRLADELKHLTHTFSILYSSSHPSRVAGFQSIATTAGLISGGLPTRGIPRHVKKTSQ